MHVCTAAVVNDWEINKEKQKNWVLHYYSEIFIIKALIKQAYSQEL
jgi:hypothetical protein